MRVLDAEMSVYNGLRAMGWRRYLCAMWLVCGEVLAVYDDRWSAAERSMIVSAMEVIRTVAQSGQVTAEVSGQAAGLYGRWEAMVRQDENRAMPGQWNAWVVYRDLMAEVAGSVPQYEAAERVSLAVTDRWRESSFERPVPIYEDPDEEVADSSLMAQVLARLDGIVAGVAGMSEPRLRAEGWDRMKVRAILPAH